MRKTNSRPEILLLGLLIAGCGDGASLVGGEDGGLDSSSGGTGGATGGGGAGGKAGGGGVMGTGGSGAGGKVGSGGSTGSGGKAGSGGSSGSGGATGGGGTGSGGKAGSGGAGSGGKAGSGGSPGAAFYVSPSGDDGASGTSPASPFKTLARAQTAMRASSSVKTTYVMGGTFNLTASLSLGSSDAGESWLGYAGQIPVLEGGGSLSAAIVDSGGANVTIRWLTIQNFTQHGIRVANATGVTIDSNTITDIASTGWNQAPIEVDGTFTNGKITHNLVRRAGYTGIAIHASTGNDISGALIDSNAVYDTMLTVSDGGAIYLMDRAHSSTNITVSNNVVGNFGTTSNGSKGIYLDDLVSNVTITSNIVWGTGKFGVQYHGGDHNVVRNNIFDITKASMVALYQDCPAQGDFGMGSNVFSCNIVYSTGATPSTLWQYSKGGTAAIALPSVSGNDYWKPAGTLPNSGTIVDSSPVKVDPGFVDAAGHDYAFKAGSPMTCFQAIDTSTVGPLPH